MYELNKDITYLKTIKNKFELVLIAAKRAREIASNNTKISLNITNDKATIIALKEMEKNYKKITDIDDNSKKKI